MFQIIGDTRTLQKLSPTISIHRSPEWHLPWCAWDQCNLWNFWFTLCHLDKTGSRRLEITHRRLGRTWSITNSTSDLARKWLWEYPMTRFFHSLSIDCLSWKFAWPRLSEAADSDSKLIQELQFRVLRFAYDIWSHRCQVYKQIRQRLTGLHGNVWTFRSGVLISGHPGIILRLINTRSV
jgi:hypothetical protein